MGRDGRRTRLLGRAPPCRRRSCRQAQRDLQCDRRRCRRREPRSSRARDHARHALGDGSASPHGVPQAGRAGVQGAGHRRTRRPGSRGRSRDLRPRRPIRARRRVRSRCLRSPAEPDPRRDHGPAGRGLAGDPCDGRTQQWQPGSRRLRWSRTRLRQHRNGDVRNAVRRRPAGVRSPGGPDRRPAR